MFQTGHGVLGGDIADVFATNGYSPVSLLDARHQEVPVSFNDDLCDFRNLCGRCSFTLNTDHDSGHRHWFCNTSLIKLYLTNKVDSGLLFNPLLHMAAANFTLCTLKESTYNRMASSGVPDRFTNAATYDMEPDEVMDGNDELCNRPAYCRSRSNNGTNFARERLQ